MAQDPSGSSKDPKDKAQAKGPSDQRAAQTGAGAQQGPGSSGSGQAGAAINPQLVQQVAQALAGLVPTNVLVQQAQLPTFPTEPLLDKLRPVTVAFRRAPMCSSHSSTRQTPTRSKTSSMTTSGSKGITSSRRPAFLQTNGLSTSSTQDC
jgi:hypothetical protein